MFHSFSYSEPAREIIPKACHVMIFVSLFILVLFQVLATSPARGGGARPIISSSFCFLFLYFSLFKDYCFQTGGSLAYASTTTPLEIGMSERVGKTLVAMARRMLADSGLPKFLRGEHNCCSRRHAVSVQNATRNGVRSVTSSSHWCQGRRVH